MTKYYKNVKKKFAKKVTANEQFKRIGKELLKIIFELIKDLIEDEVDLTHVLIRR